MNFYNDVARACRARLLGAGYTVDQANSPEDDVLDYLRVARRRIEPHPRKVYSAAGLICPTDLESGFEAVKHCAAAGQPLRPYQSKRVAQADYEDALLNAWDIHHFHLGATIDASGWAARTGPLLFARVTAQEFFCVAILDHGDWTSQDLISTIHRNWPASIEQFRMKGVVKLARELTDENVKALRKANINAPIQVEEGTVYMSPGMGSMTDGTGTWVRLGEIQLVRLCRDLERFVEAEIEKPNSEVRLAFEALGASPENAEFYLTFDGDNVLVVDRTCGIAINVGPYLAVPALN